MKNLVTPELNIGRRPSIPRGDKAAVIVNQAGRYGSWVYRQALLASILMLEVHWGYARLC